MIDLEKIPLHKAIAYSLTVLSFTAPGTLYLYLFSRAFLLSADSLKVILVSIAISWPIYIASALEAAFLLSRQKSKNPDADSDPHKFLFMTSIYVAWTFYPPLLGAYLGQWSAKVFIVILSANLLLAVIVTAIRISRIATPSGEHRQQSPSALTDKEPK